MYAIRSYYGLRPENQNRTKKGKPFTDSEFIKKTKALFGLVDMKRFGIVFAAVLLVVIIITIISPAIGKAQYVEA